MNWMIRKVKRNYPLHDEQVKTLSVVKKEKKKKIMIRKWMKTSPSENKNIKINKTKRFFVKKKTKPFYF